MRKLLYICLTIIIGIYLLLAFKDVYSVRTLAPNLEPFPDTLYYSNPAWNFAQGNGFVMKAFDFESKIITPPLYSIYLVPFFAIFQDVRSFYFANILLGIGTIVLFFISAYKLLYKKSSDIFILATLGFLLVTSFYIYTVPALLMAENITLFLAAAGIYLVLAPLAKNRTIFAGILGVLFVLIKFSNAPLTVAFYGIYGLRVIQNSSKAKLLSPLILSVGISILVFAIYIATTKILVGHKNLSSNIGFSQDYFSKNIIEYFKVLMGQPERYLWFQHRMISPVIALASLIGIGIGLQSKKWRQNSIYLLIYGLSPVIFMSFFYLRDIRYILTMYPVMLIFAGLTFLFIKNKFGTITSLAIMVAVTGAYLLLPQYGYISGERAIISFKKQVGLNLRHAETPWHYNAVQEFNAYFSKKSGTKKPYLGTLLPPYYVNYFANGNYEYLPVSMGQEFFGDKHNKSKVYVTSLAEYYTNLLEEGHEIYVSPYYQSNLSSWEADYNTLVKNFNVELVKEGCFNTCNIYKLSL